MPDHSAPANKPEPATPEAIGFLLVPDFTLMAFSAAVEPLRVANRLSGATLYRPVLLSRDGGPVRSSGGQLMAVDHALADAPALSTLILCGGIDGHAYDDPASFAWLRQRAARGLEIGSVCTASHILARAGLLSGYRCTVHWENLPSFAEAFPKLTATGELFTIDRDRFTCAGGTAALDLMLHRIGQRHGRRLAIEIAEQFLHETIRAGSVLQHHADEPRPRAAHSELLDAIGLMQTHLEAPLAIPEIAVRVGATRRGLERLFQTELHCAPAHYYRGLRLRAAQRLLSQTRLPVTQIALSCGFASPTHFSRAYRAQFGIPPRTDKAGQRVHA
ncbi:MAG TPA: GlxA family transcriptional regulator [Acetobacteraceae bacterium]|nr:GlxA family transcriptional regulator [Acetobacteraceae bacterium]